MIGKMVMAAWRRLRQRGKQGKSDIKWLVESKDLSTGGKRCAAVSIKVDAVISSCPNVLRRSV
jgi:hypothetical protein